MSTSEFSKQNLPMDEKIKDKRGKQQKHKHRELLKCYDSVKCKLGENWSDICSEKGVFRINSHRIDASAT